MAQTAVIIGDSHVDDWSPFGSKLESGLEKAGYQVTRLGVGATSTYSWSFGKACRKGKCVEVDTVPKGAGLLLICLGTNDGANAQAGGGDKAKAAAKTAERIKAMADKYGASRTIWILPPWQRGNMKHYTQDAMEYVYAAAPASGVELFDSRPSTKALVEGGSGDGVHPTGKSATAWADAILAQVRAGAVRPRMGAIVGGLVSGLVIAYWLKRRSLAR